MRFSYWPGALLLSAMLVSPPETTFALDRKDVSRTITTSSGLIIQDIKVGDGREARTGDNIAVHYMGWLATGVKFDGSHHRDQPFQFKLGAGQVIKGWDEGIPGLRVGGLRKLIVPSRLGYGPRRILDLIPENAELTFEIELIKVK